MGRQHNPNHQVSLTIGKNFNGGIIGGVQQLSTGDFGATDIGSVKATDTLASFGKTVMTGVGIDSGVIDYAIVSGSVIQGALK